MYILTHIDREPVGYFNTRADAFRFIKAVISKANTRKRVSGEWGSFSPLFADEFRIAKLRIGISKKAERKLLKEQWGGWMSEKTLRFIAARDSGI